MADQDFNIRLKTIAETAGIDLLNEEVEQLTQELLDAKIGSEEFTEAQKKLEDAIAKQSEATVKTNQELPKAEEGIKKVGGQARNTGAAVLEFSRAFEDAQYVIRGVLNNIPTLLGALGIGAGVVSVAAVALTQVLGPAFTALDEKLDLSGKASDKRKEKAAELNETLRQLTVAAAQTDMSKYIEALDDAAEAQGIFKERMEGEIEVQQRLRVAREETAQAQIALEQKLLQARVALGQLSPEEAAAKTAELQKLGNQANLEASIATAKEAEIKAQNQVELQKYNVLMAQSAKAAVEQDIRREEERYEELLAKQLKLKANLAAANAREAALASEQYQKGIAEASRLGPVGAAVGIVGGLGIKPGVAQSEESAVAMIANQLQASELRMRELATGVTAKLESRVQDEQAKLTSVSESLERTKQVVSAQIDSIENAAKNEELIGKVDELQSKTLEAGKAGAEAVKKIIDGYVPQTRLQEENFAALQAAVADGELSLKEAKAATQQLASLGANIKGSLSEIMGFISTLISDNSIRDRQLGVIAQQLEAQSQLLKSQAAGVPN